MQENPDERRRRKRENGDKLERPRSLQMQKVDDDMEDYESEESYRRQDEENRSRRSGEEDNRSRRRYDGDGSRRRDDLAGFGMREDVEKKLRARQLAEEEGRGPSRSRR